MFEVGQIPLQVKQLYPSNDLDTELGVITRHLKITWIDRVDNQNLSAMKLIVINDKANNQL